MSATREVLAVARSVCLTAPDPHGSTGDVLVVVACDDEAVGGDRDALPCSIIGFVRVVHFFI